MTHIHALSKSQAPAYASILEWQQIGSVLILFTEVVTGIIAAAESVTGFLDGKNAA